LRIEQINAITTRHQSPDAWRIPRGTPKHQNNQKLSLCFFQIVKEQGTASSDA
jgi:hypothetical protein